VLGPPGKIRHLTAWGVRDKNVATNARLMPIWHNPPGQTGRVALPGEPW
jgi:hypothetical protein